ncbi:SUZ domain-containing protein 1 [Planococcus citri]|uniref:SUZ domain-containing protein 1 n=1 Tax=Planococcus citri TaxID=170843 RepID=UPI0031F8F090
MLSNSQPVIKILKRPPNLVTPEQVNGLKSCNVKPQPVIKSLQQREMEYAEARLRIFGTTEEEERLQNSKNQSDDAPKKIIKPTRRENVIRYPKGPDGTKGFNLNSRCRQNLTNSNDLEEDKDQLDIVSNGFSNESH